MELPIWMSRETLWLHQGGLKGTDDCGLRGGSAYESVCESLLLFYFINRVGHPYPVLDPLVRLHDLRTMRPLPPITFPPGAFLLKFHPKFTSSLFIISQSGQLQFCEAQGDLTNIQMLQAPSLPLPLSPLEVTRCHDK